ncbi:MAG: hypothetical protein B6D34_00275 [Candidatus Brocadia sp. UTAMX1]|jgi:tetrahydromethanopterin S-methyltransferase subunit E|nr:MAG: hypothetical protein B6D34_00275 [Candidatus Brocadia sp. UTAMX1]
MEKSIQNDRNTSKNGFNEVRREMKSNGYFCYAYCASIAGIIALLLAYFVFFLKIVVDFMKEASLGLMIPYPL